MPIPTPTDEETKQAFTDRCMSNDVMKREYSDTDQRLAVCSTQWDRKAHGAMNAAIRRKAGRKG